MGQKRKEKWLLNLKFGMNLEEYAGAPWVWLVCVGVIVFAPVPAAPAISAVLQLAEIAVNPSILLFHLLTLTASDFFSRCLSSLQLVCLKAPIPSFHNLHLTTNRTTQLPHPTLPHPLPIFFYLSVWMIRLVGVVLCRIYIHTNTHAQCTSQIISSL